MGEAGRKVDGAQWALGASNISEAGGTANGPIAALDPGRDKCGFAVLDAGGVVLCQCILPTARLAEEIGEARRRLGFSRLLCGNGTTSKAAKQALREAMPDLAIDTVDEYRTTEDARREYWKANPPKGIFRFIPTTMRTPPCPVDDYVAVLLARRFWERHR